MMEGETEKGPSFVLFQLDGLFAVRGLSSVDKFEGRSFFLPTASRHLFCQSHVLVDLGGESEPDRLL